MKNQQKFNSMGDELKRLIAIFSRKDVIKNNFQSNENQL